MNRVWRRELPLLAILLVMAGIAVWSMGTLPERVPLHWNARGEADAFGSRTTGAWFTPCVAGALYVLTLAVARLGGPRASALGFADAYRALRASVLVFMLLAYVVMQIAMHGIEFSMTRVILPLLGGLFLVLAWVMGKLPAGAGATNSERMRRLSREVFVADGLLFIAAGIVAREWALWVAIGGVLIGAMRLVALEARTRAAS